MFIPMESRPDVILKVQPEKFPADPRYCVSRVRR